MMEVVFCTQSQYHRNKVSKRTRSYTRVSAAIKAIRAHCQGSLTNHCIVYRPGIEALIINDRNLEEVYNL